MSTEDEGDNGAFVPLMHRGDGPEPGSTKHKVGSALESKFAEFFLMFLILCDVILVSIEAGIDHQYICIEGNVVNESPHSIAGGNVHHFGYAASSIMDDIMDQAPAPLSFLGSPLSGRGMRQRKVRSSLPGLAFLQEEPVTKEVADVKGEEGGEKHGEGHKEEHAEGQHHDGEHGAEGHHHGDEHGAGGHHEEHGHGHEHGAEHGAENGGLAIPFTEEHGEHGHHEEVELALVCDHPTGHHAHHIAHTCHTLSICILLIFLAELLLKYWVHPKHFCSSKFELLDLFVVVSSLIVDIYISWLIAEHREGAKDAQYILILLIVLRLWRVVRIIHGIYQIKTMEDERGEKHVEEKEAEIKRLKDLLQQNNIDH